jgi:hypothetical protein
MAPVAPTTTLVVIVAAMAAKPEDLLDPHLRTFFPSLGTLLPRKIPEYVPHLAIRSQRGNKM